MADPIDNNQVNLQDNWRNEIYCEEVSRSINYRSSLLSKPFSAKLVLITWKILPEDERKNKLGNPQAGRGCLQEGREPTSEKKIEG